MIETLFSSIIEISLTTGIFLLIVMAMRGLFRRVPRRVFVLLWLVAGIRLLIPLTIESPFSARGVAEQWQTAHTEDKPAVSTNGVHPSVTPANPNPPNTALPEEKRPQTAAGESRPGISNASAAPVEGEGAKGRFEVMRALSIVWLCGVALFFLYGIIRYVWLRFRLRDAVRFEGNVWQSDRIDTPFLFGLICPGIYVPFGIEEKLPYVLAHERTHQRHGDHIIKALWFAALALYWFHPLVWLAYGLLGRDMELACDERVISGLNEQEKSGYARALLEISMDKRPLTLSPLAFGEVGVKMRIVHVLSYKKPAIFGALACLAIGAVFAAVLLTDPKSSNAQIGAGDSHLQDSEESEVQESEDAENPAKVDESCPVVSLGGGTVGTLCFDTTYQADFDGDGRMENVSAAFTADGYLVINLTTASGNVKAGKFKVDNYGEELESAADGVKADIESVSLWDGYVCMPETNYFYITDIDRNDKYLELAFLEYGPSDDWETRFVRLVDGELAYIGSFTASPDGPNTTIAGDGTIKAPTRFDLIQTSFVIAEWNLTADGELVGGVPAKGEFLYAEQQYQSDMPVTAARDFAARLQDVTSSALASVTKGTKLCIWGFRGMGALPEDNTAFTGEYVICFYYYDANGNRVDAEVYLTAPFGQVNCVGESFESPMELFDGLSMAG